MDGKKNIVIEAIKEIRVNGGPMCPDVVEAFKVLVLHLTPSSLLAVPDVEVPPLSAKRRFEAGDIVKCVRKISDSNWVVGLHGVVVARDKSGRIGCDWFDLKDGHGLSAYTMMDYGHGFWVDPDSIEFVTHLDQYDTPLKGHPYYEDEELERDYTY